MLNGIALDIYRCHPTALAAADGWLYLLTKTGDNLYKLRATEDTRTPEKLALLTTDRQLVLDAERRRRQSERDDDIFDLASMEILQEDYREIPVGLMIRGLEDMEKEMSRRKSSSRRRKSA